MISNHASLFTLFACVATYMYYLYDNYTNSINLLHTIYMNKILTTLNDTHTDSDYINKFYNIYLIIIKGAKIIFAIYTKLNLKIFFLIILNIIYNIFTLLYKSDILII